VIEEKLLVYAKDVNRLFDQAGSPWLEELLAYLEEQTMVTVRSYCNMWNIAWVNSLLLDYRYSEHYSLQ
jgi:hypothetical protein